METRFGVLAVPETYKRPSIDEAAKSLDAMLHKKGLREETCVGIGTDDTLVLYLFAEVKLKLPTTWEGFTVKVKHVGVPQAINA